MKIGDLVYLNRKQFYEFDEHLGIILEILETPDGNLVKVGWDDDEVGWYHVTELEAVNER